MPPTPGLRVAVHHTSPLVRAGLVRALRRSAWVGSVTALTLEGDRTSAWAHDVDVLIAELRRGDDPLWQYLSTRPLPPELRLVALHAGLGIEDARRALEAGFRALVPDDAGLAGVLEALVPSTWAATTVGTPADPVPRLEPVEQRVLRALSLGETSRRAAGALGMTPGQFDDVKQRVFVKLGVGHQSHAVATALRLGLLHETSSRSRDGHSAETQA